MNFSAKSLGIWGGLPTGWPSFRRWIATLVCVGLLVALAPQANYAQDVTLSCDNGTEVNAIGPGDGSEFIWLVALKGAGLAGVFLPGVETDPALVLPFELAPVPILLTSLIALSIVTIGSIYSTWRAATTSPALALR